MKFIPKELKVHYRNFNPELPVPDDYKHLSEEYLKSCSRNAAQESMRSFFVSMHDEGTKAYNNRTKTAKDWAKYGNLYVEALEKVVSNTPTKGFKFINTTRRYRTNNVLFQIEHPEGFIFEISSENAYEILENCTVQNCEIKDELFFNTNRYLLNTNFETYKEQAKMEKSVDGSSQIKVGDVVLMTVQCKEFNYSMDVHKLMYLGKTHIYTIGDSISTKEHVFRHIETSKILICKDSFIKNNYKETHNEDSVEYKMDFIEDLGAYVQEQIHKFNLIEINYKNYKQTTQIICADNKPIKRHHITQKYIPIDDVNDELIGNVHVLYNTTYGYLGVSGTYFLNPNRYYSCSDVPLYAINNIQNVTNDDIRSEYYLTYNAHTFSIEKFKELRDKNTIQVKYFVER